MKNTYIIHTEREDKKLLFMYKPFVDTIKKLFSQSKFLYNEWQHIDFSENDVVIFVGWHENKQKEFERLRNKKVYLIYYWSEPFRLDHKISKYFDEIYLYSKCLFTFQKKSFAQQKIKFVPILKEDTTSFVNYLDKKENMKLCFLGELQYRSFPLYKEKYFISKYNLFNEDKYNEYIVNNTHIFLNLKKREREKWLPILPICRISKLLSHKCIIISEHCNEDDDELFKDMVYFCNKEDIEETFYSLLSKSPEELQNISNQNYIKFCDRFNGENDDLFLTK